MYIVFFLSLFFRGNQEILAFNSKPGTTNKKAGRRPAFWTAWLQRVRCCGCAG
jgi:hypothetical protein